jgi:energy-converting hydrogenase Eha subunit A
MVAGNGSILAIRTRLAEPIPSYLANDFAWLNIARLRGFKVCFDPSAIAREATAPSMAGEFRRRSRIMTRGLSAIGHAIDYHLDLPAHERLETPDALFFFAQLICKKLFRYLAFPALLLAMLLTPFLSAGLMQALGLSVVGAFSIALTVGCLRHMAPRRFGWLPNTLYPIAMASASIVALFRALWGRRVSTWTPEREVPAIPRLGSDLSDTSKVAA